MDTIPIGIDDLTIGIPFLLLAIYASYLIQYRLGGYRAFLKLLWDCFKIEDEEIEL